MDKENIIGIVFILALLLYALLNKDTSEIYNDIIIKQENGRDIGVTDILYKGNAKNIDNLQDTSFDYSIRSLIQNILGGDKYYAK